MISGQTYDIINRYKERKGEINMKPRKAFYRDNIETIKELEDKLFDLTMKMEKECGKQDF